MIALLAILFLITFDAQNNTKFYELFQVCNYLLSFLAFYILGQHLPISNQRNNLRFECKRLCYYKNILSVSFEVSVESHLAREKENFSLNLLL